MTEPTSSNSPGAAATRRRSRAPLALGLAFLIGVLVFYITFQVVNRFRPRPGDEGLIAVKDRTQSRNSDADFAVPILNASFTGPGPTWKLADQRGKVVILNLFATWCVPCREEMPVLVALAHEYADRGVVVVGLSVDHDNEVREGLSRLEALRDFAQQEKPPFSILLPPAESPLMTNAFPIPQTLLFDKHGRRAKHILSTIDKAGIERSVDELLKEE